MDAPEQETFPQDTPPPGLSPLIKALHTELMTGVHERLHLVALECQHVSISATHMVLLATLAALMLCGAWATILVGLYILCTAQGMPWQTALLLILLLNLVGAVLSWLWAHALSKAFAFPVSRRMLKALTLGKPDSTPPAASSLP